MNSIPEQVVCAAAQSLSQLSILPTPTILSNVEVPICFPFVVLQQPFPTLKKFGEAAEDATRATKIIAVLLEEGMVGSCVCVRVVVCGSVRQCVCVGVCVCVSVCVGGRRGGECVGKMTYRHFFFIPPPGVRNLIFRVLKN